jgi:hypothetical protein
MYLALLFKATRLLIAVSVSLWIAGGCLFGCSNTPVMAAEVSRSAHSHSCCTRPKTARSLRIPKSPRIPEPALRGVNQGMKDCPLAANATAITAKNSGSSTDSASVAVAALPSLEKRSEQTPVRIGFSYLPNRGPTHLRCCVFLI